MSIKESGVEFADEIHNELVKVRADQMELAQDLTERINGVANHLKRLDARVEKRFEAIDQRFEAIDQRFEAMDRQFVAIDQRFVAIDRRFDGLDRRLDAMDRQFEAIDVQFGEVGKRLDTLESTQQGMVTMQAEMMQVLLGIQRKLDVN
ncbi:hypothetical protein [Nonomuraea maritima]|uniref:hypothetical protein n=1 Tax=Nonomuraea maritima TaxID=683260 RepID=UPI003714535C